MLREEGLINIIFIVIPTVCYAIQGSINLADRDYPHAWIWFAYSLGNLGFIWHETTK